MLPVRCSILLLLPTSLFAFYAGGEVALTSGFRNAGGNLQGNMLLPYRNEAWFTTGSVRLEIEKVDFYGGVSYLYSQVEIEPIGKKNNQGFGDPFAGVAWHLFYENYYLPGMVLESELNIPTGEEEFSAKIWLNRTRLLLTKSLRPFTISASAAVLAPFGKKQGLQNQIGIFSLSVMRSLTDWFFAGLFADYHSNSLSDNTRASHLGLSAGIPMAQGQFYFYGGKEILQAKFGWFAGGGVRYQVF